MTPNLTGLPDQHVQEMFHMLNKVRMFSLKMLYSL